MEYGISSYVWVSPFTNETFDQLKHAKSMGYDIYEVAVEKPELIDALKLKHEAKKVGIKVYICGAFGETRDISSTHIKYQNNGINYLKQLIDIAEVVESPIVSGPMYSATGKTELLTDNQKLSREMRLLENLTIVNEYAKKKGIKLAIEPLNRFETDYINTTDQALQLINKLNCDNIGLLLDTFHMNIEEKNMFAAIRLANNKIFNFHASSNDRGTPGEGSIHWEEVYKALEDINYQGPITIESFTTEITEIARAVSLWRPIVESQDDLAKNGIKFLKKIERRNEK